MQKDQFEQILAKADAWVSMPRVAEMLRALEPDIIEKATPHSLFNTINALLHIEKIPFSHPDLSKTFTFPADEE